MKRIILTFAALISLLALQGCFNEEPKATEQDKANIDRLAKEGIGARPVDGNSGPAKTAEDAQPSSP